MTSALYNFCWEGKALLFLNLINRTPDKTNNLSSFILFLRRLNKDFIYGSSYESILNSLPLLALRRLRNYGGSAERTNHYRMLDLPI